MLQKYNFLADYFHSEVKKVGTNKVKPLFVPYLIEQSVTACSWLLKYYSIHSMVRMEMRFQAGSLKMLPTPSP